MDNHIITRIGFSFTSTEFLTLAEELAKQFRLLKRSITYVILVRGKYVRDLGMRRVCRK